MEKQDDTYNYNDKKISFGKMLRFLRDRAGYTQIEFAKLIGYSSTGSISLIERGDRNMSKQMCSKAAEVLGVNERLFHTVGDDFNEEVLDMYLQLKKLNKNNPTYLSIKKQLENISE